MIIFGGGGVGNQMQSAYKYLDQAYTSINFANKALKGHVINSTTVNSLNECIHRCMEKKEKCMSFNIGRINETDHLLCELNKVSRMYYPQHVVEKYDYYYYDVYWGT